MHGKSGLLLVLLFLCPACPASDSSDLSADAAPRPGLLEDCSPGPSETPCKQGLRCGMILVGDPPYQGNLTQCVPVDPRPLMEEASCVIDEPVPGPTGAAPKRSDRCAPGFGCVPTPSGQMRCRRLCPLRASGTCEGAQLCVVPAQVSGVGYCATPDKCQPVSPQQGCPAGPDGHILGCYVLTDDKMGGTFCLPLKPLQDEKGDENSPCKLSSNCQPGLSCANVDGNQKLLCRPYCAVAPGNDGLPDGGDRSQCAGEPGTCNPISHYGEIGRCY